MRTLILILLIGGGTLAVSAQHLITGTVTSAPGGLPLPGATVRIKGAARAFSTNSKGAFELQADTPDRAVLVVSFTGYKTVETTLGLPLRLPLAITLHPLSGQLEEVMVSTGYYQVAKERATGSFARVGKELLDRSTSTDIISRLEGVVGGLQFDRRLTGETRGEGFRDLRLRGVATVQAETNPLIIVDNFPYDGDIGNINPNDVADVSVLKDAAAASIWGARAGNGVIVITTHKGRYNQPVRINFSSNTTVGQKPDLFYDPSFIEPADFIAAERELFAGGFYDADINSASKPPLTPVVELLTRQRAGHITEQQAEEQLNLYTGQDIRRDARRLLYRNSIAQQYALNLNGGGGQMKYYVSGGYDRNAGSLKENSYERISFNSSANFKPAENVELTAGIAWLKSGNVSNGISMYSLAPSGKTIYPYAVLQGQNGQAMPIVRDYQLTYVGNAEDIGLFDWQYRPLDELALNDNTNRSNEVRLNTGLTWRLLKGLAVDAKYQYQQIDGRQRTLYDAQSYYVRNLVNRYTQQDGSRPFPEGAILNMEHTGQVAHSARGQLNYNRSWQTDHELAALGGAEVRQVKNTGNGMGVYGYNDDVLTSASRVDYITRFPTRPRLSAQIPTPFSSMTETLDRYVSWFGNAAYTYKRRYTLSASARRDASNLFGVKANQKHVPLWSAGLSWIAADEDFYHVTWLPYLRLRATYGYSGNIDKSVTAFTIVRYSTDGVTGLPVADVVGPGNPHLRWEKVRTVNLGIDFRSAGDRFTGGIEYYRKQGRDLLGKVPLDPTTGYDNLTGRYYVNNASVNTRGLDIELNTVNVKRVFNWQSTFLVNYVSNRVKDYEGDGGAVSIVAYTSSSGAPPRPGKPLDQLLSVPWAGLDPETGDPLVLIDGTPGKAYTSYFQSALTPGMLVENGVTVPLWSGSVRNTFQWRSFSLSALVTWKAGYYFRRSSVNYEQFLKSWKGHRDLGLRWQQPGDEAHTTVPSMPASVDAYRDLAYTLSEVLVEKGDHVRLQDVNLGYSFSKKAMPKLPVQTLRAFLYVRNAGILWRTGNRKLDPDYPSAAYPPATTISLGLSAGL